MLTKNQFLVLNTLRQDTDRTLTSQAMLATKIGISVGTVNSTVKALRDRKWLKANTLEITKSGLTQLEPYKVQNAIIMAAGFSSRFAPLSYERPKGLLTVRNEILIERQIEQLKAAGITDITIVVGYLKELFFYLGDKYDVQIVINDEFDTRNNHSSLYRVREKLGRTFICSSDNYFAENVFEPYVYEAYYAGVYAEGPTDEWCMTAGAHDVISEISIGGHDSWYMLGHVYFDDAFSERMRQILTDEYDLPSTRDKLWENLYMDHLDEMRMVLRRYPDNVIWEFDKLSDMQSFDADFINNVDSSILDNIASILHCHRDDITNIEPLKSGRTNLSCRFRVNDKYYVYRYPGIGTQRFINRASETATEEIASRLGFDSTFIFEDPISGWKLSHFIDGTTGFDYENQDHVESAIRLAKCIHTCGESTSFAADIRYDALSMIPFITDRNRTDFSEFTDLYNTFLKLVRLVDADQVEPCLCHNDLYAPNILIKNEHIDLIDWEYSGMGDYAGDLGTFICCSPSYSYDDVLHILKAYFGNKPTPDQLRHCIAYISIAAFRWYVWSFYQDIHGKPVGELQYTWYRFAKDYGKRALELYSSN